VIVFQRSDARAVSSRLITLPHVLILATAVLLLSATISLAADTPSTLPTQPKTNSKTQQQVMVVPSVTGQLFVFASGSLEDAGFGWKVRGAVGGYQSNMVVSQSPKAGTHVVDTGEPTITLQLERKGAQLGTPQNRSPYGASLIKRPTSSK
jgi:hypothetical protein